MGLPDYPPRLDRAMPLVRTDRRPRIAGARPPADPSDPVIDSLVGSLVVLYAFDYDDGFHLATGRDLEDLGIDRAALAAAATDNLIERMAHVELLERPDGCAMVRLDGNLEASAVLVTQLWHDVAEILADEVVISIPTPDTVLFCGAADLAARRALLRARDRAIAVGDQAVTTDLFRFAGGGWQLEAR